MKQWKGPAKEFAVDCLYDCAGGILYATSICVFAKEAAFAPGGVSGLALICNHLWGLPIGVMTLVINIPIVLLSYKVVGRTFLLKSLRTMLVSTFLIDVVFPHLPAYTGDRLLASAFAGVIIGAGMALIYMRGSSTGGSDFLVVSVRKLKPHLSMGQITLLLDGVVILLGGLVYRDINAVLYGAVATFAASSVMDRIMYGAGGGKLAIIITTNGFEVAKAIDRSVSRGSTVVRAIGPYSGTERHLLLCACSKSEIFKVRNAVHAVDDDAFVMITEASEVFGEGFKSTELDT